MQISDFPKVWIGTRLPSASELKGSTYYEFPLPSLPHVEDADDLQWLAKLHPTIMQAMKPYRPSTYERQVYAAKARDILAQAEAMNLVLPISFSMLIQSEELQDRFPSWTACYFDLPASIVQAPFGLDGHIIRFLNDQQICVLWYLYLPRIGSPVVLASYAVEGLDFLEELNKNDKAVTHEAAKATYFAAESLPGFLRRYWIENYIQFKTKHKLELTALEVDYLGKLDRSES
jgi:hypothetical protein